MNDDVDTLKPWTVKAVSSKMADRITAAARREGITVGQMLERSWQAYEEAGEPTHVEPTHVQQQSVPLTDLQSLCDLVRVTLAVSQATGQPIRAGLQTQLANLAAEQIRTARGLPPNARRLPRQAAETSGSAAPLAAASPATVKLQSPDS